MVEEHEIDMNSSLVDQGIIDSFGLVEISAFLNKEIGVETLQEEMTRENFGSIEKILIYISKQEEV